MRHFCYGWNFKKVLFWENAWNSGPTININNWCNTFWSLLQNSWWDYCAYEIRLWYKTLYTTVEQVFSPTDFEQSSISIKQGQLVHVFKKWGPEYKIEFDIRVKKVPSNYTNIVQFTIGGKQGQYGDRIPGVWLEPSIRRVYVSSGVNGLINHEFRFEYSLNQQVHIVVKQFKDADTKYKYEIKVDGNIVHSVENTLVKQFTDVKFYACAPFDDACFTNDIGLFENFQFFH